MIQRCMLLTLLTTLVLAASSLTLHAAERPNVIIVLTDDQGYADLSLHGNPVLQTPHMDRLATTGVQFDQFHVTPMCTPTRGAMLTGVHPLFNGANSTKHGRHSLRPELPTMPETFADAGYRTAIFGKWHLGRNWPNRPQDVGFQYVRGHYGYGPTGVSSRWDNDYYNTWMMDENDQEIQGEGFCTDIFFNEAMSWIGEEKRPTILHLHQSECPTLSILGTKRSDREI